LVVSRLDRLARSLGDLCDIMDRAEKHGWTLLILDPMVDLSDPFGQCMAQVAGAFAQLERRLISQRQKESVAARKAAGTYKKPQTWITPEAEERIAHLRSDGMSLRGIARQLELEGFDPPAGNRWHPKSIARSLRGLLRPPDASVVPHHRFVPRSPLARAPGTSTGQCVTAIATPRYGAILKLYWPCELVSRLVETLPAPYFVTRAS
jgi:hypothetical protein